MDEQQPPRGVNSTNPLLFLPLVLQLTSLKTIFKISDIIISFYKTCIFTDTLDLWMKLDITNILSHFPGGCLGVANEALRVRGFCCNSMLVSKL